MGADTIMIHDYPGLGLPLRYIDSGNDFEPGSHNEFTASHSDIITVRELGMMYIMEKLTDKPNWHKKVFDVQIVAKWKQEALAIPDKELYQLAISQKYGNDDDEVETDKRPESIMSEVAFECCIEELRDKAMYFEQTSIIPTLDATGSVAKSDNLVTGEVHQALRNAFERLIADQGLFPDWHPNSGEMVQDLVHPSMYPFVYGRSLAFREECVGVADAVNRWAGKGAVIPKEIPEDVEYDSFYPSLPKRFWSDTYQWLPANIAFREDGGVRFTSYINNLHPVKYPDIYSTIEELIQTSLPMWDQCLVSIDYWAGRTITRISLPMDPDDENIENWIPSNKEDCAHIEVPLDSLEAKGYKPNFGDDINHYKWLVLRRPKIPEPSYKEIDYTPKGARLIDRFRDSGLQIIVKMASIELSPDKPEFPVGGWHVEGQMNEHICATALYYLDSENITDSNLSFRMQTNESLHIDLSEGDYNIGQASFHWMEAVHGTNLSGELSPCLQNYGSVRTPQRRLLAFPNTFQHRVSSFKLIDPTRPGHRRFIALWLVDPARRIISTANVPPQQMNWYADALLGSTPDARKEASTKLPAEIMALMQEASLQDPLPNDNTVATKPMKLPQELMDMVRGHLDDDEKALLMNVDEAREHRLKLMAARSVFIDKAEDSWHRYGYNFCEH